MSKIILYLFVIPLVIYAMDSVNFNFVFKKYINIFDIFFTFF